MGELTPEDHNNSRAEGELTHEDHNNSRKAKRKLTLNYEKQRVRLV